MDILICAGLGWFFGQVAIHIGEGVNSKNIIIRTICTCISLPCLVLAFVLCGYALVMGTVYLVGNLAIPVRVIPAN